MDKIINILLLVIIFVFDPLAIALVIAANFAFDQIKKSPFISKPIKIRQPKRIKTSVPEGMEFNKPYPMPKSWYDPSSNEGISEMLEKEKSFKDLKKRVKESQDKLKITPEDEKRMDVVGQNGNDGLHYDELDINKDGKVDENEIEIEIKSLKLKANEVKKSGDDFQYETYLKRIKALESKLTRK